MSFNKCVLSGLTALAGLGLSADAFAGGRNPGSLLLYPEFDNTAGVVTVVTVTNVDAADVTVEFKYIGVFGLQGPVNCEEFNRNEDLTGNDTLTLITNFHNPQQELGFLYVYAKDENGDPRVHNGLIGNLLVVNGIQAFNFSMNAVAFDGLGGDADGDGLRDLDGVSEYEAAPGEILVPRFFGQGQGSPFASQLILIGLAGGAQFNTSVDFLIYNDNEEVFSAEYTFHCWDRVPLLAISGIFSNQFLQQFTNHDLLEVVGAPAIEAGWFSLQGALANSPTTTIAYPAVYAVLVEQTVQNGIGVSDLPWERGSNDTGQLYPRSNNGEL